MTAWILGTVLAVAALAFVLYPVFAGSLAPARPPASPAPESEASATARAVEALREVEFDRATGKLSESDYADLKATYTREALAALRSEDAARAPAEPGGEDEIEAAIRRHRDRHASCTACGPRPESDARYCSECGSYLAGVCSACGAPVTEAGARYCASCGRGLAA